MRPPGAIISLVRSLSARPDVREDLVESGLTHALFSSLTSLRHLGELKKKKKKKKKKKRNVIVVVLVTLQNSVYILVFFHCFLGDYQVQK